MGKFSEALRQGLEAQAQLKKAEAEFDEILIEVSNELQSEFGVSIQLRRLCPRRPHFPRAQLHLPVF